MRGRGIGPGVGKRSKASLYSGDRRNHIEKIASRSGQAIEPRHDQYVAGGERTKRSAKLRLPDWIEVLSGAAPDDGDGSTEWGLALFWASVSVLMFGFAGRSWLRRALRPG